ncbi:MAG: hypothetical protein ACLFUB_20175 [Cyclobacteriaceae bacterium]
MKLLYYHIALILLLAAACEDPLEDKVFAPQNAHVRFEYREVANGVIAPQLIPLDTLELPVGTLDTLLIPVILSSSPINETVVISYTADYSSNIQQGDILLREEGDSETDFLLNIPPGSFEAKVFVLINEPIMQEAYLTLRLEEVTPDFLNLGLPGPQAQRRSFTIKFVIP